MSGLVPMLLKIKHVTIEARCGAKEIIPAANFDAAPFEKDFIVAKVDDELHLTAMKTRTHAPVLSTTKFLVSALTLNDGREVPVKMRMQIDIPNNSGVLLKLTAPALVINRRTFFVKRIATEFESFSQVESKISHPTPSKRGGIKPGRKTLTLPIPKQRHAELITGRMGK